MLLCWLYLAFSLVLREEYLLLFIILLRQEICILGFHILPFTSKFFTVRSWYPLAGASILPHGFSVLFPFSCVFFCVFLFPLCFQVSPQHSLCVPKYCVLLIFIHFLHDLKCFWPIFASCMNSLIFQMTHIVLCCFCLEITRDHSWQCFGGTIFTSGIERRFEPEWTTCKEKMP